MTNPNVLFDRQKKKIKIKNKKIIIAKLMLY